MRILPQFLAALALAAASFSVNAQATFLSEEQVREAGYAKLRAEQAEFEAYPIGKTFWYLPGGSVPILRKTFYRRMSDQPGYPPSKRLEERIVPTGLVRFEVVAISPLNQARSESAYELRLEDGSVAYMHAREFGHYQLGRKKDITEDPDDVRPGKIEYNTKLLTKHPDELKALYAAQEVERLAAAERKKEAEEAERKAAAANLAKLERAELEERKREYARKGGVKIGMNKKQVIASVWGRPLRVNTTTTATGVSEQWVYGGSSYLYFLNGILRTIQN